MVGLKFYLVDVFAQEKFAGNQLAVFPDAGSLSSENMQKIANEMHFSETTFILSREPHNGGLDVRIFTPTSEVPFAGHPTLGTAYIIRHFIAKGNPERVLLNLGVGQVPVTCEGEVLWMRQVPPKFGSVFDVSRLAEVLQLSMEDFDGRFPIQEVSTGMPFIVVPIKTLDAIKRASVNIAKLREMAREVHGGILVFCPQTVEAGNNLHVRVFVDLFGIPEDPATGSGNGCLAAYLSHYRYFGSNNVEARVEQGYEMRRPSILLLRAKDENGAVQVEVGGQVFLVGEGELFL